jgi:hypothetical protein
VPHPGDAHAGAWRQSFGCTFHNFAYNLVTWNQLWLKRRQVAFSDMEVGAGDSTCDNPQQHMAWSKLGTRDLLNPKMSAARIRYSVVDSCSHITKCRPVEV